MLKFCFSLKGSLYLLGGTLIAHSFLHLPGLLAQVQFLVTRHKEHPLLGPRGLPGQKLAGLCRPAVILVQKESVPNPGVTSGAVP